jgi:ketosteroid isomerase-like protein
MGIHRHVLTELRKARDMMGRTKPHHEAQQVINVIWLALVLALAAPSSVARSCATAQAKDERTLLQLEQTWAKALEQRDAETVACLVADEFQDAGVDGTVHERAEMLANMGQRGPNVNRLEDMHARVYGDFAYVRGINRVNDPSGKQLASVRFTDVFVYRDGRWQAVAGQETLVKESN